MKNVKRYILFLIISMWSLSITLAWGTTDNNPVTLHHASGHVHTNWLSPPNDYLGLRGSHWFDLQYIVRGEKLYQDHCLSCHGQDGRGDGIMASALEHPPADLTKHFHPQPGKNDDYLFWRVSEGGTAEPFSSLKSAMPAFKKILTDEERWSVLAYIHNRFHQM